MALKNESQGLFEAAGHSPFYTGIGALNASHYCTQWVIQHRPKLVINLGTAGSLLHPVGELVECTSFVQRHPIKQKKISIPPLLISNLPKVCCGSGDFVEDPRQRPECEVFDMEAYALAFVCESLKVKFCSFKCISDNSDEKTFGDWRKNLAMSSKKLLDLYEKIISTQLQNASFE